jgi:hypothetical protein
MDLALHHRATAHSLQLAALVQKLFEDIQRRKAAMLPSAAAKPGLEREVAPACEPEPEASAPKDVLEQSSLQRVPPDLSASLVSKPDSKIAPDQDAFIDMPTGAATTDGASQHLSASVPRQVVVASGEASQVGEDNERLRAPDVSQAADQPDL